MQINRSKVRYSFETSADRRLNFTLAHEIGHIMLDHLRVSRNLKTPTDIEREEREANFGNSRFCEMCGKPTYLYEKGHLQDWK